MNKCPVCRGNGKVHIVGQTDICGWCDGNGSLTDEQLATYYAKVYPKTCGKCGGQIPGPGPCPTCEDKPFGVIEMKPRGWNRATPEERAAMEKGCNCQSAGFGVTPDEPCPYHSKPHYYSYAMGEYGRIHFLIEMPSGWLVGIPEHAMKEQMELQEPDPNQDQPYHTHTLIRPDETREPPDEPAAASDALSKFVPFRHCPAPARDIPDPDDSLAELESKVKHILHWLVEWGQKHDASIGTFWDGLRNLRQDFDAAIATLAKRVEKLESVAHHPDRPRMQLEMKAKLEALEKRVKVLAAHRRGPVGLMRFR